MIEEVGVRDAETPDRPSVMAMDHQGKSRALVEVLAAAGCPVVDRPDRADVVLIDHDVPFHGRLPAVEACVEAGGKAFLYPHGAEATMMACWDGMYPVSPLLSGALVTGPGHVEVARRYGYHHPVFDVGWMLCDLAPRRTVAAPRNVLFAPMHPPWECGWNAAMFARLLELPVSLTVRHLGTLEANDIHRAPGVTFVEGDIFDFGGMLAQIDAADVVVAPKGTFMSLAVARGAPVVTWRSDWAKDNSLTREAVNLDRYVDLVRYPFDADHGDLWDLCRAAARDVELQQRWCDLFIGGPLDVEAVLRAFAVAPRRRAVPADGADDPKALHAAALRHLDDGDVATAQTLLAAAVSTLDPDALNDLAVLWSMEGRREEAIAALRVVLALHPGHGDAWDNLYGLSSIAAN